MPSQENAENMISINRWCSMLAFEGTDAINFLNNLIISELQDFALDCYYFSALCNPKGRVLCSFWLKRCENGDVFMICPKNMREQLQQFFTMRRFRLKISIAECAASLSINQHSNKISDTGNEQQVAAENSDNAAFLAYLFSQNIAWIDATNTEKFIPQHLNYDKIEHAMSFSKGCYHGQEIIARIKYLGTIKKRLSLKKAATLKQLQDSIADDEQVSPIVEHENSWQVQVVSTLKGN